jgi:hypothetical protein
MSEDDGTMVCCFAWKKSRNDERIWAEVIAGMTGRRQGQRVDWQ